MSTSIYNFNTIFEKIDLSHLRHFYSIASHKGFTNASKATGQSQPALSLGLKKLENDLGFSLVDRSAHGFDLTEEGKLLFNICQDIEDVLLPLISVNASNQEIQLNKLRLGSAQSIGFDFITDKIPFENLQLSMEFRLQRTNQLLDDLTEGNLDCAFIPTVTNYPGLDITPLIKDKLVFVVGRKWKEIDTKILFNNFDQITLIRYPFNTPLQNIVDEFCESKKLKFTKQITTNSIDTLCRLVISSAGGGFVLRSIAEAHINSKELFTKNPVEQMPETGLHLAVRKNAKGAFIKTLVKKWMLRK